MNSPAWRYTCRDFYEGRRHGQGKSSGVASGRHYKGGFVNDREEDFATVRWNGQYVGYNGRGQQLDVSISGLTKMYGGPWVKDRLFEYGRFSLGNSHI